jgi:hypothetical protein
MIVRHVFQEPKWPRHGDYDQLTFDKGWILNVKVLHNF